MPRTSSFRLRDDASLIFVVVTGALFWVFGERWFATFEHLPFLGFLSVWLFLAVIWAAFAVVRHADALAEQLGEPLGTVVLTLSVTSIEVLMISSVMLVGADNPELARDAMYSVVMIVLNGVVGSSLLLGGIRHREQQYNLQGANAFLAVIICLAVLALVLPTHTHSGDGPRLSSGQEAFLVAASLGLYGVFLAAQTVRHRQYFTTAGDDDHAIAHQASGSPTVHALLLIAYLAPVVSLSEQLAIPLDHSISELGAPPQLAGLLIALLTGQREHSYKEHPLPASLSTGRAGHLRHERDQLRRRSEAHELTGGDMLDPPDEELSPRIGLEPELHHERPLRRKRHLGHCKGSFGCLPSTTTSLRRGPFEVRKKP